MKLESLLLIRKRMAILGVTAFAAAGGAHAQFTGIGTTTPSASLHIVGDTTTVGLEAFRLETIRDLQPAEVATYDEVLVYDSGTGLFRRETIADLLDDNGEWVYDATTQILAPRRTDVAGGLSIDGIATTATIGFATTINSTLNATGNVDFDANANVDGTLDIGTVAQVTAGNLDGTDEILLQQAGTDLVEYVTVTDLISNASYWDFTAGVLQPADANLAGDITIQDGDIDIAATLDVTGNTAVTGTFGVTGNSTLTGTLDVTAATGLQSTLEIGSVAQVTAAALDGSDEVLIQQAGADLVEYVTVTDLISNASYWDFDATNTTLTPADATLAALYVLDDAAATIGTPTTITNTLTVGAFATSLGGTLAVTGNTDLTGTLDIGTVAQVAAADIIGTDEVLLQQAGTDLVEYVTVDDLISSASYWDFTAGVLQPADANLAGDITIQDGDIDIVGTFDVTGNSTLTGTLNVTGNVDFDANANVDGTLDIGTVAQVAAADIIGTDEILLQQAGTNLVEYVTVDDLLSSSGEWVYDAANTRIYARRAQAGGADVWVTDAGNHVVEIAAAYQFGDNTNQVTATGITSSTGYALNTADAQDVSFQEAGSGAPWLYHDADAGDGSIGRVGINTNAPAATLHVAGNIVASNSTVTSDKRFKRDIEEFTGALSAVKSLRGVSYRFRADEFPGEQFDDAEHLGFIAQELREVLPQAVMERTDGYLTVDYGAVAPVLVEAVQELSAQVEALQAENASLKAGDAVGAADVISKLEARIADLDARLDEVAGRK